MLIPKHELSFEACLACPGRIILGKLDLLIQCEALATRTSWTFAYPAPAACSAESANLLAPMLGLLIHLSPCFVWQLFEPFDPWLLCWIFQPSTHIRVSFLRKLVQQLT